jgi:hypothetical protein
MKLQFNAEAKYQVNENENVEGGFPSLDNLYGRTRFVAQYFLSSAIHYLEYLFFA